MTLSVVLFKSTAAQVGSVPTCSTFLQPQSLEDLLKLAVFAEIRQFDMHSCAQACAEVGWTGEDVAKMLVPHERVTLVFEQLLDLKGRNNQLVLIAAQLSSVCMHQKSSSRTFMTEQ